MRYRKFFSFKFLQEKQDKTTIFVIEKVSPRFIGVHLDRSKIFWLNKDQIKFVLYFAGNLPAIKESFDPKDFRVGMKLLNVDGIWILDQYNNYDRWEKEQSYGEAEAA